MEIKNQLSDRQLEQELKKIIKRNIVIKRGVYPMYNPQKFNHISNPNILLKQLLKFITDNRSRI